MSVKTRSGLRQRIVTVLFAAAALLLFAATAHAAEGQAMDTTQFREECRFAGDATGVATSECDLSYQEQICDKFADALEQKMASMDECLAACEQVKTDEMIGSMLNCSNFADQANVLCERVCRGHFK